LVSDQEDTTKPKVSACQVKTRHWCLSVSYQLPSIARLCHEWIMLPMKSLTAFCSVSTAGFLCILKHPLWVSAL
ncbi:hypothetical protein DBR06_SOUSAS1010146, partial [Sousa chinensis]